jgi:hypothetical protein
LSFFPSSPAKEGALKANATATAMMAINMRFIVKSPPLKFEKFMPDVGIGVDGQQA